MLVRDRVDAPAQPGKRIQEPLVRAENVRNVLRRRVPGLHHVPLPQDEAVHAEPDVGPPDDALPAYLGVHVALGAGAAVLLKKVFFEFEQEELLQS